MQSEKFWLLMKKESVATKKCSMSITFTTLSREDKTFVSITFCQMSSCKNKSRGLRWGNLCHLLANVLFHHIHWVFPCLILSFLGHVPQLGANSLISVHGYSELSLVECSEVYPQVNVHKEQ